MNRQIANDLTEQALIDQIRADQQRDYAVWQRRCEERMAKGAATTRQLAEAAGQLHNSRFYGWLRQHEKVFARVGLVAGVTGHQNVLWVLKPAG